jgi:hypothetical protein
MFWNVMVPPSEVASRAALLWGRVPVEESLLLYTGCIELIAVAVPLSPELRQEKRKRTGTRKTMPTGEERYFMMNLLSRQKLFGDF